MAAPIPFSLATSGTDPKVATKEDLETAINASLDAAYDGAMQATQDLDESLVAVAKSGDSDDLTEGAAKLLLTPAERTKVGHLTATAATDLDAMRIRVADLSNVDNTADADKPVSTAQQAALDGKADSTALTVHEGNEANPHAVTAAQVGLGNVDNTSDADKPVSTAQQAAFDAQKAEAHRQRGILADGADLKNVHAPGCYLLAAS
ncbi:hypothetical protein, partial [Shimia thalassica]